jgi:ABC-type branched-subunit amino acid transport system substrate-binding protein
VITSLRRTACRSAALLALILLTGLGACTTAKGPAKPVQQTTGAPQAPASALPQPIIDKTLFSLPQMLAEGREPVRVGILLPLSGPQASIGHALLDSAQLAIFESGRKDLLLLPQDTQGTPQGAIEAMMKAVSLGAEIVLGPLMSEEVSAVTPVARANGVPVIAFSSRMEVAGPGVYLLSFPPALEVDRVVGYAVANGKSRIAALIPESDYGSAIESALRDSATAHNAMLGPIEHYQENVTAMQGPVKEMAQLSNFDAVLLPAGGSSLRALAPLLPFSGIDTQVVKVLGTGLWDDPSVSREPTLQGGWFAAPPPEARASFTQRYRTAYGTSAPRIASLAYDGIALAATLADAPEGHRFTPERVANPNGFAGVDGAFRFEQDGRIERALAVNEVTQAGIAAVSPAPATFQGLSQ